MPPPVPYLTMLRQETVKRLAELTTVFPRVYDSRLPQLKRELLPAIRVYTNSAAHLGRSISIPDFRTTAHLIVQIICEDITDAAIAERIDVYCEVVKNKLLCDGKWLQLFERCETLDLEIDRNVEGEWRLTTATLDFGVTYSCSYEPVVPDWLLTVGLKVDVIDPAADPNTGPPGTPPNVDGGYPGGYPGPDGRIEVEANFIHPGLPVESLGNLEGINSEMNPLVMLATKPLDPRVKRGLPVQLMTSWPAFNGRWFMVQEITDIALSQFRLRCDTTNEPGLGVPGSIAVLAAENRARPRPTVNPTNGHAKGK
jgi:hypothetical protein